jgi:hypothetical protein
MSSEHFPLDPVAASGIPTKRPWFFEFSIMNMEGCHRFCLMRKEHKAAEAIKLFPV